LKKAKNYFIEAKINKLAESVTPHQSLFQHHLGYVWSTIYHEKLFTQNVTNITFIYETSQNTKPKEIKVGGHGILCPLRLKKWGDTSPCPPPNCAHDQHRRNLNTLLPVI